MCAHYSIIEEGRKGVLKSLTGHAFIDEKTMRKKIKM